MPNVHYEEIGEDTDQSRLNVYVPYAMDGSRPMAMLVRAQGSPEALIAPMREALRRIGPTFPIFRLMTMRELRKDTTWEQEFFGDLMAVFAGGALLLACLGIYALISYSVGRRSREIGVRLALGARPADVVRMLLRETARVGGTGLIVGLIARDRDRARAGRARSTASASMRGCLRRWRCRWPRRCCWRRGCRRAAPRASSRRSRCGTSNQDQGSGIRDQGLGS